jgi:hypothetical protein
MKRRLTSSGGRSPHPFARMIVYAARVTKNDALGPMLDKVLAKVM